MAAIIVACSNIVGQSRMDRMAPSGHGSDKVADIVEYAPAAFPLAKKIIGSPTRSAWGRMVVSQGISTALMVSTVFTLKHLVSSQRPDRSDCRSFPSGHSAWAFMGAAMVAKEFGWKSPWYSVGAYTLATGIAVQRVVARHHKPVDVAVGAVIGIAMTEIGYRFADMIYGDGGLGEEYMLHISPVLLQDGVQINATSTFNPVLGVTMSYDF